MIITVDDLPKIRQQHADETIVLVSGVFDLLHAGHLDYLEAAKVLGDRVVALVKSDERVKVGKGPTRPMLPEEDRVRMIAALKGVDYAFVAPHLPFEGEEVDPTYKLVFTKLRPDVFYSTNSNWQQLEKLGIGKIIIQERPAVQALRSTTDIIAHIVAKQKGQS